jgi:large subunit ribosomal protein L18
MATGPRYKVAFRRRREGKTDYHARRRMVSSGRPRLVIRITDTRVIVQIMQALPQGDRTIAAADSRQLTALGWHGGAKNLPAAYLTGYLTARQAVQAGVSSAVTDLGLIQPIKGSRVFGAIKGAIDAGLQVPCTKEMLPEEKRIRGDHIAAYVKDLSKKDPEALKRQFGKLSKGRTDLTTLPSLFEATKAKIDAKFRTRRSEQ